jgi:GNAT superfamily N-acetyltransferase
MIWTRGQKLSLQVFEHQEIFSRAGIMRALADGVSRNFNPSDLGELSTLPYIDWYVIRETAVEVGILGIQRDLPQRGTATARFIAVDPQYRGNAVGTRAILIAEKKLRSEGYELFGRVPETNGRGLYFWLRCGFVGQRSTTANESATWFQRISKDQSNN